MCLDLAPGIYFVIMLGLIILLVGLLFIGLFKGIIHVFKKNKSDQLKKILIEYSIETIILITLILFTYNCGAKLAIMSV